MKIIRLNTKSVIIIILVLAAFLRLCNIWYMEFKADEASNSFLAAELVGKKNIPLTGIISSIGVYNPPIFIYLLSLPFFFSKNPVVAAGYIALLNVLAVYICFLFCVEFFNKKTAIIAAAFFAVSPWAILYSRKIWNQDILPPFIIIFFYSLYKVIFKKQDKYILVSFIALAIITQLHLSGFIFFALLIAIILASRPTIKPLYYIIGISCVFLLYLPYILFDITHNFYNLNVFFKMSRSVFMFRPEAFVFPFRLITPAGFTQFSVPFLNIANALLLAASVLYLLRHHDEKKFRPLLLWFFIPMLFLSTSKIPVYPHYFILFFPVQFILIGIFIDAVDNRYGKRNILFRCAVFSIVAVLVLNQLICSFAFVNDYIRKHDLIFWQGYGVPFKYRVDEIKQNMEKGYKDFRSIHMAIVRNKTEQMRFKYDLTATEYIVENIGSITTSFEHI